MNTDKDDPRCDGCGIRRGVHTGNCPVIQARIDRAAGKVPASQPGGPHYHARLEGAARVLNKIIRSHPDGLTAVELLDYYTQIYQALGDSQHESYPANHEAEHPELVGAVFGEDLYMLPSAFAKLKAMGVLDNTKEINDYLGNPVIQELLTQQRTAAEQAGYERGAKDALDALSLELDHLGTHSDMPVHEVMGRVNRAWMAIRDEYAPLQPPQSGEKL